MGEKDSLQPASVGDFLCNGFGITRYMDDSFNGIRERSVVKKDRLADQTTELEKESLDQLIDSGTISLMEFQAPNGARD